MTCLEIGASIWVFGMLLSLMFCRYKWERGVIFKLLPILYGFSSGLVTSMLRNYEIQQLVEFTLGCTFCGLIFSAIAWFDATFSK
jgi:hypothetical protein